MAAEDHKKVLWMGAALMALAMLMAVADPAHATPDSRIRAGNCKVYQTVALDPIAATTHLHSFTGGTVQSNATTGFDLEAAATSCNVADNWATSAVWFPTAQTFTATKDALYYRDPGDQNNLMPIPTDLRLLSETVIFRGTNTSVRFPNCLAVDSTTGEPVLDSIDHMSHTYDARAKACPAAFPYRIPQPAILIHWPQSLQPSTPISEGSGLFGQASTSFHADYLAGNQAEFNDTLIDLCLNNVPARTTVADPACGLGP